MLERGGRRRGRSRDFGAQIPKQFGSLSRPKRAHAISTRQNDEPLTVELMNLRAGRAEQCQRLQVGRGARNRGGSEAVDSRSDGALYADLQCQRSEQLSHIRVELRI